jgi:hypothetical protein
MQLIPHNLQSFSINNTKYNIVLPTLTTSPYFLLPCYLENDDNDNDNVNESSFYFSKDK